MIQITKIIAICLTILSLCLLPNLSQGADLDLEVEVDIDGLGLTEKPMVLNSITLYRHKRSTLITDSYIAAFQQRGIEEVVAALQALGYYKSTVDVNEVFTDTQRIIRYIGNVGDPLLLNSISIDIEGSGDDDQAVVKWREEFPLVTGGRLIQPTYENAKKTILRILQERGYFNARLLTHTIEVDLKVYQAQIIIHINTGPRFQFGETQIEHEVFAPKYLRRFITYNPGDVFINEKLVDMQQDLISSGEFKSVTVQPLVNAAHDLQVPIKVDLLPRKPWRYNLGLGYGTDTGIRLSGSIERRQITQKAHSAEISGTASNVKKDLVVEYRFPLKRPASEFFVFSGSRVIEDTDTAYSQANNFSGEVIKNVDDWIRTLALTYTRESFIVSDEPGRSRLLIPSLRLQYLPEKKLKMKYLNSWRISSEIKGAHQSVLSDNTFAQIIVDAELVIPFTKTLSFATRGELGTSAVDDFSTLPASLRFFAGGDTSIRGYKYASLGPKDENDKVIGGLHLLVGSVELRQMVTPNWELSAFLDAGNAFDDSSFEVMEGAGAGIGWRSPIGTIRVYGGNALSDPDRPWRAHILFGMTI